MEEERTKVLIAIVIEKQKVAEKETETQKKKMAIYEAEKNANGSKIMMEQKLMERGSTKLMQQIENEIYLEQEKSLADANAYKMMKEAEANKLQLTPQYLERKFVEAIANNSKNFCGNKLPNMIFDQSCLGASCKALMLDQTRKAEFASPVSLSNVCTN